MGYGSGGAIKFSLVHLPEGSRKKCTGTTKQPNTGGSLYILGRNVAHICLHILPCIRLNNVGLCAIYGHRRFEKEYASRCQRA